jgi:hypothetical protein
MTTVKNFIGGELIHLFVVIVTVGIFGRNGHFYAVAYLLALKGCFKTGNNVFRAMQIFQWFVFACPTSRPLR